MVRKIQPALPAPESVSREGRAPQLSDAVVAVDLEQRITFLNAAAEGLYSVQSGEMLGRKLDDICARYWPGPQEEKAAWAALREHGQWHGSYLQRTRQGREVHVDSSIAALRDAHGGIIGYLSVVRDIMERKREEETLHASESLLRLFVQSAPGAFAQFDREMRYLCASGRWLQDFGLTGDITGRSHYELFPELPEAWKEVHRRAQAGETMRSEGDRFERADGRVQWVKWEVLPWRDARNEIGGILIASEDITARKLTEEALHASERQYLALAEASSEVPYRMSSDWSTLLPLDGRELFASTQRPIADWAWMDHYLPRDEHIRVRQMIREAIARKSLFEMEHRVLRLDGSIGWVHSRALPVRDVTGEVVEWFGAAGDITQRKRAEQIVRASEDGFKAMANAAPAILWVTNPEASVTFLSRAWHEYTGQTEAQAVGNKGFGWLDAVHPEDREASGQIFLEAHVRRAPFSMDYRVRRADGQYRWAIDAGRPRFDEGGGFLGYVGSVIDVHERVLAGDLRRRLAETFERLVEDSPLGIYTVDAEFRIRHVSKGALTAFCSVRPLIGRDFSEVVRMTWPEPIANKVIAIFRRTLETGEAYISPGLTAARHDLRSIESYEWQTNRVTLDDGKLGVVCYFFDSTRLQEAKQTIDRHAAELEKSLTERTLEVRRAERAVAISQRMAAVGTLAAGLAHDMSNLLLPLGVRLDALSSGKSLRPGHPPQDVPEDVKRELLVLSALLDHLRALARNLSLFSRDPSNEGGEGTVHLGRWCQQASKLIDASIGPSIVVKWDCPDGLDKVAIAPHRLTQAVQNLVHNARDAILTKNSGAQQGRRSMPIGHITVAARLTGNSRNIELVVSDDGAGMSEEVLQHCREPFYTTMDRSAAAGVGSGGSGLGLSLADQIIERAGGTMQIQSTLGVGTTITMRIPIAA